MGWIFWPSCVDEEPSTDKVLNSFSSDRTCRTRFLVLQLEFSLIQHRNRLLCPSHRALFTSILIERSLEPASLNGLCLFFIVTEYDGTR